MPQEEKVVNKILTKIPHVDLVFGTHNIYKLPEYLESVILSKERVIEVYSEEGQIVENLPKIRENSKKAWVSIMFGCDEFCTYCIVPYTRGKERSRLPENIIQEVQELIDEGYQEVTLLGQNVNSYGNDFTDKDYRFKDLLNDLNKMDIPRVRFTTSHPKDFDEETVKIIAQGGNLMPYIHLPVQSGSNNILKRMNRKYTKETYLQLVKWIYKYIPNASLTTDIIVGFPGETKKQFENTVKLFKEIKFDMAYISQYSSRAGTAALNLKDNISQKEKKERDKILTEVLKKTALENNKKYVGREVKVLFEKEKNGWLIGKTREYKTVKIKIQNPNAKSNPNAKIQKVIGDFVKVKIIEADLWGLKGKVS